ncbi:DNA polymerase Y family protein [Corynebacterium sp. TAE3-ERU12]|uniref:Y-family DNA polymerase n=1 Tax=Corynebacterium sp. TAE3-ERU12 TaxID=2849491 RepID=UPI001C47D923|nr:DNA polymerase Y family protein [Corynebacterium sp. TAE3-ERU12]MBV7294735.1 DNA polymerase Y family protein [Corynebacterium sp. TAE3-ERU12]
MTTHRVIVVWLPDWPVQAARLAAGAEAHTALAPAAIITGNQVSACSAAARRAGIRRGHSRRYAQASCPQVQLTDADPTRDAAQFEPVLAGLCDIAAGVESLRPGLVAVSAYGPARYHGSEDRAMELLVDAAAIAGADCLSGVADDLVTAVLAARRGVHVPPGQTAAFMQHISLIEVAAETALGLSEDLVEMWSRMGLRTLGDIAGLPAAEVANRFGAQGAYWHRVARGDHGQGVSAAPATVDLSVQYRPEEPVHRVDTAAFIARSLAGQLHHSLREAGYCCTRLAVSAELTDGARLRRVWRCTGPLTEATTADRVRWQLDGWLTERRAGTACTDSDSADEPGGIVELQLEPLDVNVAGDIHEALWGGPDGAAQRAERAAIRVQGLLGPDAVRRPVTVGGRGPQERVALVPVGEEAPAESGPWPGAVLAPSPPLTHPSAQVQLLGDADNPIAVTGRGMLTDQPTALLRGAQTLPVTAWAGPWPIDERWWVPDGAHRAARMQVVVDNKGAPEAYLLIGHKGKWRIEGAYR